MELKILQTILDFNLRPIVEGLLTDNTFNNRRFVGRLIYAVLTEQKSVKEAISLFPDTKDKDIELNSYMTISLDGVEHD